MNKKPTELPTGSPMGSPTESPTVKTEPLAVKYEVETWALEKLQNHIKAAPSGSAIEIDCGAKRFNGLGAGVEVACSLMVNGSVGDCVFLGANAMDAEISGSAGDALGHSLESGNILVHGQAGNSLGCYATGGFIAVHRHAGDRCAEGLAGADLFVRGKVGAEAGAGMRDGILVVGNGAGAQLGLGMLGGIIYVRGDVASLSADLKPARIKDSDQLRLSLLLARAGVKAAIADFRMFVPRKVVTRESVS